MRTCFCAVQVNRLAEPFILVNFIIRMQQSIFWGKLSGKKMMCFYNPKVKFVDFIRKLCLNILLLTHLPRSSPQQQAPGVPWEKLKSSLGRALVWELGRVEALRAWLQPSGVEPLLCCPGRVQGGRGLCSKARFSLSYHIFIDFLD